MIAVVTGRRREKYDERPTPPYLLNKDCSQAQGLVAFWPLGEILPTLYFDYVRGRGSGPFNLTQTGTMTRAVGPFGQGLATSNTGVTTNYLSVSSTPVTATPITCACWIYPFSISTYWNAWNSVQTGLDDYFNLYINNPGNGVIGASTSTTAAGEAIASATGSLVANQWQHACVVWTSATLRAAYRDGWNKGTNTTSRTPSGLDAMNVGIYPGGFGPLNGRLAHLCIWNRALTDDEVFELYEPPTRWDLYYPTGRKTYSIGAPAAGGRTTRNTLASPLGMHLGRGLWTHGGSG